MLKKDSSPSYYPSIYIIPHLGVGCQAYEHTFFRDKNTLLSYKKAK